jgi:ubiquinone/menaquinone biosynthesis C-methylase UbiE
MTESKPTGDQVRAAWDAMADFWDENMEAGQTWQQRLIEPAVEQILDLRDGERVLEIACGNGEFARRMTDLGAKVLATDFSEEMLRTAGRRGGEVEYRIADATDEDQLLALGSPGEFDAIVSNMAIMDMAEIEPMVSAASVLLRPEGRFVFSTQHPAFNSGDPVRMAEQTEDDAGVHRQYSIKMSHYIRPLVGKGVAIEGQPVTQWYFHRSMEELFGVWFRHGFVLDALSEPVLQPDDMEPNSLSRVFLEIPPILVARMRPNRRA